MAEFAVWDDTKGGGICRSCGSPITWFEMVKSGKKAPFDGDPTYVRTEHDAEAHRLIGYIDGAVDLNHFATCPQRQEWRGRGRK